VQVWQPSGQRFLLRVAVIAALTFALLLIPAVLSLDHFDLPRPWALLATALLTGILLIEDLQSWPLRRQERWTLTPESLIHDSAQGRGQLPLAEIASARVRLFFWVVVKLRSGQNIVMRDLPQPAQIAAMIAQNCRADQR
jgi:hypothetical protein